jgi:hypothetical protein
MPFLLSGADFRRRADAWKPHPKVSLTSNPAPLTAGVTSANRFGFSDAIDDFEVRTVGGALGPFIQSQTNPMINTATFRHRQDGGGRWWQFARWFGRMTKTET